MGIRRLPPCSGSDVSTQTCRRVRLLRAGGELCAQGARADARADEPGFGIGRLVCPNQQILFASRMRPCVQKESVSLIGRSYSGKDEKDLPKHLRGPHSQPVALQVESCTGTHLNLARPFLDCTMLRGDEHKAAMRKHFQNPVVRDLMPLTIRA